MQNVRDYISVKLHTTKESAAKAISHHTYKSHVILGKKLIQTNHSIPTIMHDKPIGIGISILELVIIKKNYSIFSFQISNIYLSVLISFFPE